VFVYLTCLPVVDLQTEIINPKTVVAAAVALFKFPREMLFAHTILA